MGNLIRRVLVAAIAIPILVWVFTHGGWFLGAFVALLIVLGTYEASVLVSGKLTFAWVVSVLVAIGGAALTGLALSDYWPLWVALAVMAPGILAMLDSDLERAVRAAASQTAIVLWLGFGFGSFYALGPNGAGSDGVWLLFLFGNLWISDTAAYFVGVKFGKRPLASHISPKKTIAGLVGGLVASMIVGGVFAWQSWLPIHSRVETVIVALVVGIAAVFGDLFESLWKRVAGSKDSSSIIPGHGGVLDRFDSALFAAPVLYLYIHLFQ